MDGCNLMSIETQVESKCCPFLSVPLERSPLVGESIFRQGREHLQEVVKERRWPMSLKESPREVSSSWLNS